MTHGRINICSFCKERIVETACSYSRFSTHILTKHKEEPDVKKYLELVEQSEKMWQSFLESFISFNSQKDLEEKLKVSDKK